MKNQKTTSTSQSCNVPIPAEQYIAAVLDDKIVVSSWVKKAIQRHQRDLERPESESGLRFDKGHALRAVKWIAKNATITEDGIGVKVGDRMVLQAWQQAFLWILFGWRRTDGTRRFRNVYAELARGNGKSKIASAIALYVLVGEGIRGAAVYSVATTMEQAGVVFNDAALMAQNPTRADIRHLVRNKNLLFIPGTATVFRPLASNEKTLDGLKPNLIIVDELHAHRSRDLWNVCKTSAGKKPGSMMLAITTAGFDRNSVCYEQRQHCEKILNGIFEDDAYFAWICSLDKDDDPFDPANWKKANPNLDISIEKATIENAAKQAQMIPSEYNDFLRLRCNIWTDSSELWMPMDMWDKCKEAVDPQALLGRPCFGGLDLSTVVDISAFVLVFPPYGDDTKWRIMPHFFMPGDNIRARVKKGQVPYDTWQRFGFFQVTPGKVIDFDYIRTFIGNLADQYDIQEIGYDAWNAHQIVTQLTGDGMVMVPIRQGAPSFNSPMNLLLEKVMREEIAHGNNPVLRWMANNTVASKDANGNIRPDKEKSSEKIDGIVALLMALSRAAVTPIKKQSNWKPQVW